jgi:hypothetical protein
MGTAGQDFQRSDCCPLLGSEGKKEVGVKAKER